MPTIARDPFVPDLPSPPSGFEPRSILPPGGDPRGDAEWLDWCRAVCADANRRWLDEHSGWGRALPKRDIVNMWQLSNHFYKHWLGWEFPSGVGPNRNHRVRFNAIQFRLRRSEAEAEAARYVAERMDEIEQAIP